jgi:hypothetical protein
MNIIFAILTAFAAGYFIRPTKVAVAIWLAADALLFTFQTLSVLMAWLAHNPPAAFGPHPTGFPISFDQTELIGYGVINLIITLAGVGLVLLAGKIRSRREAKRNVVAVGS